MNQAVISALTFLAKKIAEGIRWLWGFSVKAIGSVFLVIIIGMIVFSILFSGSMTESERSVKIKGDIQKDGEVVLLSLNGPIIEESSSSSPFSFDAQEIAADSLSEKLRSLQADDQVKAVILKINSPGGSVVASDMAFHAVRSFSESKPIVAVISETAASGGYYIAIGADTIFAHPASIVGSIGVIGFFPNVSELFSNIGVDMQVIRTGEYKDIGSPYRTMQSRERELIQQLVDEALDEFVAAVKEGRGLTTQQVLEIADGRIVSGRQAKALNMIDELGTVETAFSLLKQEHNLGNPSLTEAKSSGFFDSFFGVTMHKLLISGLIQQLFGYNTVGQQVIRQDILTQQGIGTITPQAGIYYLGEF